MDDFVQEARQQPLGGISKENPPGPGRVVHDLRRTLWGYPRHRLHRILVLILVHVDLCASRDRTQNGAATTTFSAPNGEPGFLYFYPAEPNRGVERFKSPHLAELPGRGGQARPRRRRERCQQQPWQGAPSQRPNVDMGNP